MNIFERASRAKTRFNSPIGELSTEQLWDLPLTSPTKANLDGIARAISGALRTLTEDSFVETKPDPRKAELELQLDIVKHVIAAKIDARRSADKAAETSAQKQRLLEALAAKETQELAGMSREDIQKQLAALESSGG